MNNRRTVDATVAMLVLTACTWPSFCVAAATPGCPKSVVRFNITASSIAEMEQSEAQGHQPWRSDSYAVAVVGLEKVEHGIDPRTAHSIPHRRTVISSTHELFTFELQKRSHLDQINVRRLRWRNPRTGRTGLTVWWAIEAVISDCPNAAGESHR